MCLSHRRGGDAKRAGEIIPARDVRNEITMARVADHQGRPHRRCPHHAAPGARRLHEGISLSLGKFASWAGQVLTHSHSVLLQRHGNPKETAHFCKTFRTALLPGGQGGLCFNKSPLIPVLQLTPIFPVTAAVTPGITSVTALSYQTFALGQCRTHLYSPLPHHYRKVHCTDEEAEA